MAKKLEKNSQEDNENDKPPESNYDSEPVNIARFMRTIRRVVSSPPVTRRVE